MPCLGRASRAELDEGRACAGFGDTRRLACEDAALGTRGVVLGLFGDAFEDLAAGAIVEIAATQPARRVAEPANHRPRKRLPKEIRSRGATAPHAGLCP